MVPKSYFVILVSAVFSIFCVYSICLGGIIDVSVSVPPQKFFVTKIGGEYVRVHVMLPDGASPATYEPSPKMLVKLENSKMYIKVGHPNFLFEQRIFKLLNQAKKNIKVISMSDGLQYIDMIDHFHHENTSAEEEIEESDPHVWLAPYTVKAAAANICRALCRMEPSHSADFIRNKRDFLKEIDDVDKEIQFILKDAKQRKFMVYHPAWGYFAKQYGLTQIAIETGGKDPTPAKLTELIMKAREEKIKVVFVQEGFPKDRASIIAKEIKGEVIEINPLEYNWLENIRKVARIFKSALTN